MTDEKAKPFHVITNVAVATDEANRALDEITKDFERGLIGINTAVSQAFVAGLEYARKLGT